MWKQNKLGIYLNNNINNAENSFPLQTPNNIMYLVSQKNIPPVKIQIEDNNKSFKTEKYKMTLKEVLWDILICDSNLRGKLTRQQIHSEKGKIKKENYQEVVNFLIKRGFTKEYINNEVNMERERMICTYNYKCDTDIVKNEYGVISKN